MSENPLQQSVQFLPGVGPERAKLLEKLGFRTVEELLWNLPRDVIDLTRVSRVEDLEADEVQTVRGKIVDIDGRFLSRGRSMTSCLLDCDGAYLKGTWFNQPWMRQHLRPGGTYLFSGKPKRRSERWEMAHPKIQLLEEEDSESDGGILPKYGLTEGLKMHRMRKIMRHVAESYAGEISDLLPEGFREHFKLCALDRALYQLHCAKSMEEYEAARHRLIFEDLLEFQLGLALRKQYWKKRGRAPKLPTTAKIDARIRRLFPFRFTKGQDEAIKDLIADLQRDVPMHRLLQADVGAGKTVVAIFAMLVAVAAGYQAVIMAPTEVLANQHYQTVVNLLINSRVKTQLLTSALTPAQRREALAGIASGEVRLVVGTQAVIQKEVKFDKLGVAIIDEQHKFGVAQRAVFTSALESPHVLVMTATPIPRSLCLTLFGDLDLTLISEQPPGRQPVVTSRIHGTGGRRKAWEFVCKQVKAGRQAYVVCPRIEEDENSEFEQPISAEAVFEQLSSNELAEFRVELLHGQMDREQKREVMNRFRQQEIDVLVSTTVIEVGVDVPNATLMVIMQSERFGLSQLHQLRGRIGRGAHQGYCFLFSETESEEGLHRLGVLEHSVDGFKVAEADFELRGPGDVLGTRQHGTMPLRVASLIRDGKILEETRKIAFDLVETQKFDNPEFSGLKKEVYQRFGEMLAIGQSG